MMLGSAKWTYPLASTSRDLRLLAVKLCTEMLPQPYNYATHCGRKILEMRLEVELSEFDFRFRQARQRQASLDELSCIGLLLLETTGGAVPSHALPIDEDLLINRHSLPLLVRWMEERLRNHARATSA